LNQALRAGVLASLLTVATATRLAAQQQSPAALRSDSTRVTPTESGWHVEQCMAGITYGAPLKLAVSYGGGFLYESNGGPDVCALAVAKVGFGGAQGSMGIGTSFAPWGTGVMVTGNVVRTFSAPLEATPRRTYVGASLHFWPAFALGGELGYLWRMGDEAGTAAAGKRILTWSVGFGF
jgi:hypothetical protein